MGNNENFQSISPGSIENEWTDDKDEKCGRSGKCSCQVFFSFAPDSFYIWTPSTELLVLPKGNLLYSTQTICNPDHDFPPKLLDQNKLQRSQQKSISKKIPNTSNVLELILKCTSTLYCDDSLPWTWGLHLTIRPHPSHPTSPIFPLKRCTLKCR